MTRRAIPRTELRARVLHLLRSLGRIPAVPLTEGGQGRAAPPSSTAARPERRPVGKAAR